MVPGAVHYALGHLSWGLQQEPSWATGQFVREKKMEDDTEQLKSIALWGETGPETRHSLGTLFLTPDLSDQAREDNMNIWEPLHLIFEIVP